MTQKGFLAMNGMVYAIQGQVMASVKEEEFYQMAASFGTRSLLMLPHEEKGIAAHAAGNGRTMFVVYLGRQLRTLLYNDRRGRADSITAHEIKLPHTYLFIWLRNRAVQSGGIFYSQEKLVTGAEDLTPLPLPNVDGSGNICIGGWSADPSASEGGQVEAYTTQLLNSTFNSDTNVHFDRLPDCINPRKHPEYERGWSVEKLNSCFLELWGRASQNEAPLVWHPHGTPVTIQSLMGRHLGESR
tara:strand:- start:295 stop:1023 length:729 start_codon:yes stop_codon:yes gene_type:complete